MRTRPQLPTWSLLRRAGHVPSSFCHASGIGVISDWTVCFSLGLPPVGLGSRELEAALFQGSSISQGSGPSLPFLRSTKVTLVPTGLQVLPGIPLTASHTDAGPHLPSPWLPRPGRSCPLGFAGSLP